MGIRAFIERFLTRTAKPSEPASSAFGAEADRASADREREAELHEEIEKQKGRPRGF